MHVTTKSSLKGITNNTLNGRVNGIRGQRQIGELTLQLGGIGGRI